MTSKTEKIVDVYKDEAVVADMVERYTAVCGDEFTDEDRAAVVAELADELGKSERSIRTKLVTEGVYKAKKYRTKNGTVTISKSQLVDDIANALGVEFTDGQATSLEKATKDTLTKVLNAVNRMHDEIDLVDVVVPEVEDEVVEAA